MMTGRLGAGASMILRFCEKRNRLVIAYANAARFLVGAVDRLTVLDPEAFKEALAQSEAASLECRNAREALLRHKHEHGCC